MESSELYWGIPVFVLVFSTAERFMLLLCHQFFKYFCLTVNQKLFPKSIMSIYSLQNVTNIDEKLDIGAKAVFFCFVGICKRWFRCSKKFTFMNIFCISTGFG